MQAVLVLAGGDLPARRSVSHAGHFSCKVMGVVARW